MTSVTIVGGSTNLRVAMVASMVAAVAQSTSYGFSNYGFDTVQHVDYQYSELFRSIGKKHLKYRQNEIQQRRKSLLKRHTERASQMACKQARRREKSYVSS